MRKVNLRTKGYEKSFMCGKFPSDESFDNMTNKKIIQVTESVYLLSPNTGTLRKVIEHSWLGRPHN